MITERKAEPGMLTEQIFPGELSPFEKAMKNEYRLLPPGTLDTPHENKYYKDILGRVLDAIGEQDPLGDHATVNLREKDYFRQNYDVDCSRHSRYSPTNIHTHDFIEMACVFKGNCINYIGEQKQELTAGDILLIAPGTRHAISAFSDEAAILNILIKTSTFEQAFSGTLSGQGILAEFFTGALLTSGVHPYILFHTGKNEKVPSGNSLPGNSIGRTIPDEEIFRLISLCYKELLNNRLFAGRLINTYLSAVFLLLLRSYSLTADYPTESTSAEDLLYILQYLQEHCLDLKLHQFAAFFGYSDRQMQRILKSAIHMTYQEYKSQLRNRKAKVLLSETEMTEDQIAEQLRLVDASHFRRFFHGENGCSPSDYKKGCFMCSDGWTGNRLDRSHRGQEKSH